MLLFSSISSHINTILVFYLYLFLFVFIRLCTCVFLKWQSYYSLFCSNLRCTVDVANSLKWWVVLQAKESFLLSSESSSEKTPAAVSELWENTETTLTTVSAAWAHTVMCRGLRSQTLSESGPAVCCCYRTKTETCIKHSSKMRRWSPAYIQAQTCRKIHRSTF